MGTSPRGWTPWSGSWTKPGSLSRSNPGSPSVRSPLAATASHPSRIVWGGFPSIGRWAESSCPCISDWSSTDRTVDLADRRNRARCYEAVLREGTPDDIRTYVDGALLIDLWDELVLPPDVRQAWQPLIDRARAR
jgi:hypothetical protein